MYLLFRPSGPSKALKLGAKGKEVDNFVDKLKSEGENIMTAVGKRSTEAAKVLAPPVNMERWVLPSLWKQLSWRRTWCFPFSCQNRPFSCCLGLLRSLGLWIFKASGQNLGKYSSQRADR